MSVVLNPTASVTDSITVSNTGGPYTFNGTAGISVPWTGTSSNTITLDHSWANHTSGKIKLDGPEADIEINGESLTSMLRNIEQRLNILKPNEELESKWSELRALGDQYRKLEQHILEKQATWDKLKAMPPPDLD
jgi:hypothetical protein